MGTHKIYSGIQGIRGSLYGDCHELLASLQFTFEPQEGLLAVSDLRQGFLALKIVQSRI